MQWDKTNLPLDLNDYTRTLAKEKNHAYLSDYFRCWLLEKYGGVYLDADIEILDGAAFRRIYDAAQANGDATLFIGVESDGNGMLTAHSMGVKDGSFHPMLRFLMNLYETAFSGPLHYAIKNFNMPYLMTLYFQDLEAREGYAASSGGRFRGVTEPLVTAGMTIYPTVYLSPLTTRDGRMTVTSFGSETCACHHFAATWREDAAGNREAKCLADAIRGGDYDVDPRFAEEIGRKFVLTVKASCRPVWRLTEKQVKTLEKALNSIIPYGSPQYNFLKGRRNR